MSYTPHPMNTQPTPTQATHNIYWISDPGHAWLAVSLEAYPDAIDYGTGFGYMDVTHIYLEEDLEAVAFLTAHPELAGSNKRGMLAERSYDFDAPVRRMNRNLEMLDTDTFMAEMRAMNAKHAKQVQA